MDERLLLSLMFFSFIKYLRILPLVHASFIHAKALFGSHK